MPSTNPVSVNASGMRLEPTAHTMLRVMVWIAPVCRNASAMMEPSTMTTPMEPSVEPKAALEGVDEIIPGDTRDDAEEEQGYQQGEKDVPAPPGDEKQQQRDDAKKAQQRHQGAIDYRCGWIHIPFIS